MYLTEIYWSFFILNFSTMIGFTFMVYHKHKVATEPSAYAKAEVENVFLASLFSLAAYVGWYILSFFIQWFCYPSQTTNALSWIQRLYYYFQSHDLLALETRKSCAEYIVDSILVIEDIPFMAVSLYLWIFIMKVDFLWYACILFATSFLLWTFKIIYVIFDWHKFWVADKLLKYYDGKDSGHYDWKEFFMNLSHWIFAWGNIISAIYFAVKQLKGEISRYEDLLIGAITSLSLSTLESIYKAGKDFYVYCKSSLKKEEENGNLLTRTQAYGCWKSIKLWYVGKVDFGIQFYQTIVLPNYHKYMVLLHELPQIFITIYFLIKQHSKDISAIISVSWSLLMILLKFGLYFVLDTYVQVYLDEIKKQQKIFSKLQKSYKNASKARKWFSTKNVPFIN